MARRTPLVHYLKETLGAQLDELAGFGASTLDIIIDSDKIRTSKVTIILTQPKQTR